MVIAKVLCEGKGSAKSQKSKDHAKKDHYLFEQRGEPNELKTSVGLGGGQATSSEQAVYGEGSLETAASEHALQKQSPFISIKHKVLAKHQRRERSARGEVSNPRQEAGEAGGMTTGNKTAGVESEESFRSEVGLGHVGMNTMDSFCLTTVSGDLTVDVGDFENGAVCSVDQIRKSRDEHEDIVKNETYAQAFGHEPERPSRKQQDVIQPPKIATPASLNTRAWIIRSSPESS